MLTPGQAHDLACAESLLENVDPGALLGDKAYDADSLIDTLAHLDRLRREVEARFPDARAFKRPGFDD